MSGTPTVSVVMTCYNEGPWIGAAVRSVLDQTRADRIADIVIADDGSDAATLAVLGEIERWDARIRVLRGPGGAGISAQRNWAIGEGAAPLIALLDGDDLWAPDKLERQLPVFADARVGLCYSDLLHFAGEDLATARRAGVKDITGARDLTRAYVLNDPPIIPSTVVLRRSALEVAGGFDEAVTVFEDTDLFIRMSRACRFALVDAPLTLKRYRTSSITGGRKDLMAHHALVAFRATATEPRLLPLVPRRLSERARKLGNQHLLMDDPKAAAGFYGLAVRLRPVSLGAWAGVLLTSAAGAPVLGWLRRRLRKRRAALGVSG
ncbi:glycosyltransferase family 2 protein [Brevundimonas staleyi]|uniref:Glycosyltransferase family 2 protein n=1 Tax=Brevundimonas staleyi TaxID=74326 RepID=A0ABW0FLV2_9CAUL